MLSRGALAAESLPAPRDPEPEDNQPLSTRLSRADRVGPRLLWWEIPAHSLLHAPSFRALMTMRIATETAINALTYGMLIVIVTTHGDSRWVGLLMALVTIATVAPAALFGPVGGVVVDRMPHRFMLIVTNLARALLCFGFLFIGTGTVAVYVLLVAITAVTQFATPAEAAVLPRVVTHDRLASANSFSNLAESGGQLVGMAILAPILIKLPGAPESLIIACGLLLTSAALRAVGVRFTTPAPAPTPAPASTSTPPSALRIPQSSKPWLSGTREALQEAWRWLAGDRAAFISMMLWVLASTANLVMVTLAPKFTREVIGLAPEFAVFVFGPAVIGILSGLLLVPKMARVIPKRLLVTTGFLLMVVVLLLFGTLNGVTELGQRLDPLKLYSGPLSWGVLGHADGRLGTALLLAIPLGFSSSMVQVAAQTLLHERVPLEMQGRVFALQGAVKNATAIVPLLALGGLSSLVGDVRPVIITAALLILFLALYGGARSAQWTGELGHHAERGPQQPEAGMQTVE
jgi:MFS family permease